MPPPTTPNAVQQLQTAPAHVINIPTTPETLTDRKFLDDGEGKICASPRDELVIEHLTPKNDFHSDKDGDSGSKGDEISPNIHAKLRAPLPVDNTSTIDM